MIKCRTKAGARKNQPGGWDTWVLLGALLLTPSPCASPFGLGFLLARGGVWTGSNTLPLCPHTSLPKQNQKHFGFVFCIKRPKIIQLLELGVTVSSVGHKTHPAGCQSRQLGVNETASSRERAASRNLPASDRRMQAFQDQVRWSETQLSTASQHQALL